MRVYANLVRVYGGPKVNIVSVHVPFRGLSGFQSFLVVVVVGGSESEQDGPSSGVKLDQR